MGGKGKGGKVRGGDHSLLPPFLSQFKPWLKLLYLDSHM